MDKQKKEIVKRTIKDSVFTDFFGIPENLLKLYRVLHPEDTEVKLEDLKDITIQNVLVDDLYNDLGFCVGALLIVLVEAQSTWSVNIIIRSLLYLATTYQRYIDEHGLDVYGSKKIKLPKPELYVIYTGNRQEKPSEITLSKEFFDGQDLAVDIKVKVLYGDETSNDVVSQYVTFTKVFDEQRKKYGRTKQAIVETIRICKDKDVLKEYLESREQEVVTMMMTLYDEEQIMKNHDAALLREAENKAVESIVVTCQNLGASMTDAVKSVMMNYGHSEAVAMELVMKYWNREK
jgi:hypothetical protein